MASGAARRAWIDGFSQIEANGRLGSLAGLQEALLHKSKPMGDWVSRLGDFGPISRRKRLLHKSKPNGRLGITPGDFAPISRRKPLLHKSKPNRRLGISLGPFGPISRRKRLLHKSKPNGRLGITPAAQIEAKIGKSFSVSLGLSQIWEKLSSTAAAIRCRFVIRKKLPKFRWIVIGSSRFCRQRQRTL
jgi:hypothetical protein